MPLSKLKLANKKARRESRRKQVRAVGRSKKRDDKFRRKRIHKLMIEGRKEHNAKRAAEKNYIKNLEAQIDE
jgi:hypothetical protein